MNRVCLLLTSALSCATSGVTAADAVADYPNRPIRFIAPFVAGGPSDMLSRLLGQKLTESWGQTVVVDNRGSAGGIVGFDLGAKAAPDGYTLLLATGAGLTINPSVYLKLPYDPVRDYRPITQVTAGAYMMVITPSVPAKSLPDFIALAKARPGQINYASAGTGSVGHLGLELFGLMTGTRLQHVPYKGTGPGMAALMAGEIQILVVGLATVLPHVRAKSDKVKVFGVTGARRAQAAPEIPTLAESGLPGYESVSVYGVFAPAKSPAAAINRLNQETVRVLQLPDIKEKLFNTGVEVVAGSPSQFATRVQSEMKRLGKLIREAGIRAE